MPGSAGWSRRPLRRVRGQAVDPAPCRCRHSAPCARRQGAEGAGHRPARLACRRPVRAVGVPAGGAPQDRRDPARRAASIRMGGPRDRARRERPGRWGARLNRNPVPILIPCHRVNRGDGTVGDYGFGPEMKRELLAHEGLDPDRLDADAERGCGWWAATPRRSTAGPPAVTASGSRSGTGSSSGPSGRRSPPATGRARCAVPVGRRRRPPDLSLASSPEASDPGWSVAGLGRPPNYDSTMASRPPDPSTLIETIRAGVIGDDVAVDGPFGPHRVTYADYTASGRAVGFIEDFIARAVLPLYANTHTESSGTGLQTTRLREEARGDHPSLRRGHRRARRVVLRVGDDRRDGQADRCARAPHPGRPRRPLRAQRRHPAR